MLVVRQFVTPNIAQTVKEFDATMTNSSNKAWTIKFQVLFIDSISKKTIAIKIKNQLSAGFFNIERKIYCFVTLNVLVTKFTSILYVPLVAGAGKFCAAS